MQNSEGNIMRQISLTTSSQQGVIPGGVPIELIGDYVVLVGGNNAGKSTLLQWLFKGCVDNGQPVPLDQVCLLLPDRMYVDTNTMTGRTLDAYNRDLATSISSGNNRGYANPNSPHILVNCQR
jgi:GTPase SAR1 family protein